MFHEGYALKVFLQKHYSVNETSALLGISRQGVNGLYGQEKLPADYVEIFKKKGWEIPGLTTKIDLKDNITNDRVAESTTAYGNTDNDLRKDLKLKDELLNLQRDTIERLDSSLKLLIERISLQATLDKT